MANLHSDKLLDLSVLDPENITSSSTPRLLRGSRDSHREGFPEDGLRPLDMQYEEPLNEVASAYSIHFSAIDPQSASSTLNLDREITRLESEDIGGPSDFTQNLADWINGTKLPDGKPSTSEDKHETLPNKVNFEDAAAYKEPTVEDYTTPKPQRTTSPVVPPQETDWQALCQQLQAKNDQLNHDFETHRQALSQMRQQRTEDSAVRREIKAQQAQLSSYELESRPTAINPAALKDMAVGSMETSEHILSTIQQTVVTLASQHDRIDELERELRKEREARLARVEQRIGHRQDTEARPKQESGLDAKQSGLSNDTQSQVVALQQQLDASKDIHAAEMAALRTEYQSVASDVDSWLVSKIKQKDEQHAASIARQNSKIAELRGRNAELERMFKLCGKELMLAWGREECGPAPSGEKQLYRYKYAGNQPRVGSAI